jgi:WD40 repeat protein/serine/threonine protein kinase
MNSVESLSVRVNVADVVLSDLFEEIAAKVAAGEPVDLAAYAAKYPDHAEQLRQLLPAVQVLADLGVSAARGELPSTPSSRGGDLERGVLGDFQIRREIGRGGMGIVYEAEQISLGRRVALKVLPFAAALDAKHLQRFKNEAQAAAHLRHPNIVPVYAVGCERGVHYYAMQYVDGHTVAGLIQELRQLAGLGQARDNGTSAPASAVVSASAANNLASKLISGRWAPGKQISADSQETGPYSPSPAGNPVPSTGYSVHAGDTSPKDALSTEQGVKSPGFWRTVANLGVQAAEALEHAHQLGVIHRDVKPANLLVDGDGQLWITDFGLARLGGDVGLTMTGDLLGTIRYMSPEQALAKRVTVDARTDVYSLGVTLYELLTLEPAYNGRNREEVLRQIAFEEPRAPRRLNRAIPAELETIVLKAMGKNPEERYATAQELADDLRRFLDDKPIRAKRPSLRQRTAKWARRHKTVVRAAVVVLFLAVAGLAAGALLIWRANQELRQNLYYQLIAGAEREWTANNLGRMQQLLDECPEKLRGWEWRYLQRLRFKTLPPLRHESAAFCAVFSPDGKRIASSDREGKIRIWDAGTGRMLREIRAHDAVVYNIAFSPDSRCLASGSVDKTVKLWDAETGRERSTIKGHTVEVRTVTFSPDGQHLAACGATGREAEVKIWEVATGREILALRNLPTDCWCVRFSPDGRRLAAGGGNRQQGSVVKVWDLRTRQEVMTVRVPSGIRGLAFSPDGKRLAAVAGLANFEPNEDVKIWDAQTGQELFSLRGHVGGLQTVAFSPDGKRLASAGIDQTIRLWDTTTGREVLALRGHLDHVNCVAFSADGDRLVSASLDKTVRVWDASPIESATGEEVLTFRGHGGPIACVGFHPTDARCLVSASAEGTFKLWDPWSGRELHSVRHGNRIAAVAFSPDGRRLVVTGGGQFTVWDVATMKEICTTQEAGFALSVVFSPDGKCLAGSGFRPVIRLFDAATGLELGAPLHDHSFVIHALAFSPRDHHLLASADADSRVRLWDVNKGQELRLLEPHHAARCTCVAFSPDGKLLASGGWDRTIKVWETDAWKPLHDLPNPTGAVQSVAFSPDCRPNARRLAWGGTDGLVKVWDEATHEVHTFRGHTGWAQSVAFSTDGKQLASGSADGTVKIWNVPALAKPAGDPSAAR